MYVTLERRLCSSFCSFTRLREVCKHKSNVTDSQLCCGTPHASLCSTMRSRGVISALRTTVARCGLPAGAALCSCRKQLGRQTTSQPKNMKCFRLYRPSTPWLWYEWVSEDREAPPPTLLFPHSSIQLSCTTHKSLVINEKSLLQWQSFIIGR